MNEDPAVTVLVGNCLDVLRGTPSSSVDAIVTDPPYEMTSERPVVGVENCLSYLVLKSEIVAQRNADDGRGRTFKNTSALAARGSLSALTVADPNATFCLGACSCYTPLPDGTVRVTVSIDGVPEYVVIRAGKHSFEILNDDDEPTVAPRFVLTGTTGDLFLPGFLVDRLRRVGQGGFMGKEWDGTGIAYNVELWSEALRVLKPGGHLLAFGSSRTFHRVASAIEDAGFEIRDSIAWLYSQGFPKSLDVSKGIDKAAGAARTKTGEKKRSGSRAARGGAELVGSSPVEELKWKDVTLPTTDDAKKWDGWGTALKPAFEPIVVARKPLAGTVVENVLQYGTGAINIDATRVQGGPSTGGSSSGSKGTRDTVGGYGHDATGIDRELAAGRWPANAVFTHLEDCEQVGVVSDSFGGGSKGSGGFTGGYAFDGFKGNTVEVAVWECAPGCQVAELDRQSGTTRSAAATVNRQTPGSIFGTERQSNVGPQNQRNDAGGASRFFYVGKATRSERPIVDGVAHPTVKPLSLMRWLVRMVAAPGATVLDPFGGSGTTAEACLLEDVNCVIVERDPTYVPLIEARIARVHALPPTLL